MTPQQIEAMKLALEALETIDGWLLARYPCGLMPKEQEAITAIKEVLAQPEQEPVIDKSAAVRIATALGWEPKRKPLTDEEIAEFAERMEASDPTDSFWREFARAIEAAHGIKENT